MDRCVASHALGRLTSYSVRASQIRKFACAPAQRPNDARFPPFLDDLVHEGFHPSVLFEEGANVARRLASLDPQIACQRELRLAIDDRKVHGLRLRAHLAGHILGCDPKQGPRGTHMHVLVRAKGFDQLRIVAEVRQHSQLDLGIVRADDRPTVPRDEGLANLATELRSDGDVLQVRIGRRQPPSGGHRLAKVCVDSSTACSDHLGKSVQIGVLELGEHTVLQNGRWQLVVQRQLLQNRVVGAARGLGLLHHRQAELIEKNRLELPRGGDVELMPRELGALRFQLHQLFGNALRQTVEDHSVHADASTLHLRKHSRQGQLQIAKQAFAAFGDHPLKQHRIAAEDCADHLTPVVGDLLDRAF